MEWSGLFDTLGESASSLIEAKAQVEIAKINARALRPQAPYPAPVPHGGNMTTSQKAAELARSPMLWVSAGAVVLLVIVVFMARR